MTQDDRPKDANEWSHRVAARVAFLVNEGGFPSTVRFTRTSGTEPLQQNYVEISVSHGVVFDPVHFRRQIVFDPLSLDVEAEARKIADLAIAQFTENRP